jgi:hypothetical protein
LEPRPCAIAQTHLALSKFLFVEQTSAVAFANVPGGAEDARRSLCIPWMLNLDGKFAAELSKDIRRRLMLPPLTRDGLAQDRRQEDQKHRCGKAKQTERNQH